jgi:hypothetical protein
VTDGPCYVCNHERTMNRCWRLTCPTNGARESFLRARPGPFYCGPKAERSEEGNLL